MCDTLPSNEGAQCRLGELRYLEGRHLDHIEDIYALRVPSDWHPATDPGSCRYAVDYDPG